VSERLRTLRPVTALLRSFGFVTAPLFSSDVLTAFGRICAGPTEFRGASTVTAATLVPPSATSSARQATTIAGDGRCSRSLCM
jgi:hypothetical protein